MSEYGARPDVEILPQNLGDLTGREATPILERAAGKIEILRPKRSSFWQGVEENLRGAAGWIDANGKSLTDKSVRVITGVSLLSTLATACAKGVGTGLMEGPQTPAINAPLPSVTTLPTYTLEPTSTIEPTATPEWENASPEDVSTWPQKYQDYWAHPEQAGESGIPHDWEFQKFLTESRRDYLVSKNVTSFEIDGVTIQTEKANDTELLWGMIQESAKEQKAILLSVSEIRNIVSDKFSAVRYWSKIDKKEGKWYRYGWSEQYAWDSGGPDFSIYNYPYNTSIYGQKVRHPYPPNMLNAAGDFAGVVQLPKETGIAVLFRLKDQGGNSHLQIFQVLTEPHNFRGEKACWDGTPELATCPNLRPINTGLGWFPQISKEPITDSSQLTDQLKWPPPFSKYATVGLGPSWGVIYLPSGLEVVQIIGIDSTGPYNENLPAP